MSGMLFFAQVIPGKPHRWRALQQGGSAAIPIAMFAAATVAAPSTAASPFTPTQERSVAPSAKFYDLLAQRLTVLEQHGREDGIEIAPESKAALYRLIERYDVTRRPMMTLRDDGTIRALWRDHRGSELSIRFVAEDDLHVGLTVLRENGRVAQWGGYDNGDGVIDALYGFDVPDLLFA